jgi:hypothetical protein
MTLIASSRLASTLALLALAGCSDSLTSGPETWAGFSHQVDVYRDEVGQDLIFCLKVEASADEVDAFVAGRFSPEQRTPIPPRAASYLQGCPAPFWPAKFGVPTLAYSSKTSGGFEYQASGAYYEGGYLYYWTIAL